MSSIGDLFSTDLNVYTFLVYGLVLSFFILFIFFYTNRILGLILSRVLSILLPNFIFIESVKIALLSGSITFKNITITSPGFKLTVHKMNGTLRYWIWRVQHVESLPITTKNKYLNWFIHSIKEDRIDDPTLPCRLSIKIKGMEIFFYNNSNLYEQLKKRMQSTANMSLSELVEEMPYDPSFLLWVLPISIIMNKCSLVVGNKSTKHLISLFFNYGKCIISFKASNLTNHSQVFTMNATKCVVKMIPNIDSEVQEHQYSVNTVNRNTTTNKRTLGELLRKISRKVSLQTEVPYDTLQVPEEGEWRGLDRYAVANQINIQEYAAVYDLLKCDEFQIIYQYDVLFGKWTVENTKDIPFDTINITIKDPVINYGPFAERERKKFMRRYFMPFQGELPKYNQEIGQKRLAYYTNMVITCTGYTDFRFPFRNFTHDFLNTTQIDKIFPYSWIDAKSSINNSFTVDIYNFQGPKSDFIVTGAINSVRIKTSLNHELLISDDLFKLEYHSTYATSSKSKFILDFKELNGFLLGDHIYLLIDALSDFMLVEELSIFNPSQFDIQLIIRKGQLLVNTNDLTIIDNHNSLHDNSHLQVTVTNLTLNMSTEYTRALQESTIFEISFELDELKLDPLFSESNLYHNGLEYLKCNGITGNGQYMSTITDNILNLETTAASGDLTLYGHLVKYLGNAFDTLFTISMTVQEYLDSKQRQLINNKSFSMAVSLSFSNVILRLPCGWDPFIDPSQLIINIPRLFMQIDSADSFIFTVNAPSANCKALALSQFYYNFNINHLLEMKLIHGNIQLDDLLNGFKWFLLFRHQMNDFENTLKTGTESDSVFNYLMHMINVTITTDIIAPIAFLIEFIANTQFGITLPSISIKSEFVTASIDSCLLNHMPTYVYHSAIPHFRSNHINTLDMVINMDSLINKLPTIMHPTLQWIYLMNKYMDYCQISFLSEPPTPMNMSLLMILESTIVFQFGAIPIQCFIHELTSVKCKSLQFMINNNKHNSQCILTNCSLSNCDLIAINLDLSHLPFLFDAAMQSQPLINTINNWSNTLSFSFLEPFDAFPNIELLIDSHIIRVHPLLSQFRAQLINKQILYALIHGILPVSTAITNKLSHFNLHLSHFHIYSNSILLHSVSITNVQLVSSGTINCNG